MKLTSVAMGSKKRWIRRVNPVVFWIVLGTSGLAWMPLRLASGGGDAGPWNPAGGSVQADERIAAPTQSQPAQPGNDPARELAETYGIRVERIKLTAAGNLLDFRYRVLDTAKAAALFEKDVIPYLLDQATGAKFMIPAPDKVGALRTSGKNLIAGRVNFMLFGNPGGYIQPGRKVTVIIGACQIKDLVVQ